MNKRFIATVMMPVVQSFEANDVKHAESMLQTFIDRELKEHCTENSPKPFLHSMRVIHTEVEPTPQAA